MTRASGAAATIPGESVVEGELAALRRAARAARRLAEATGTPFYIWRDGRVVDLNAHVPSTNRRVKRRRARNAVP